MENISSIIKDLIHNLNVDEIKAQNLLKTTALKVWDQSTSDETLQLFISAYEKIKEENKEQYYWCLYNEIILDSSNSSIILGMIDLLLQLEAYSTIDNIYINKIRESLYKVFLNSNELAIHYEIFGYLMNFNEYKIKLTEDINLNKEKYKALLPSAERICRVDECIKTFKEIIISMCNKWDNKCIKFFIQIFGEYKLYIPQIATKIRTYYRDSNNKKEINKFFYYVLKYNKEFNYKEEIVELVLSVYESEDLLVDMLAMYENFLSYTEEAATIVDDDYVNDLSTEICRASDYIEIAGAFKSKIKDNFLANSNVIDLIKILNQPSTRVDYLAARNDILLNYYDLQKINQIYREVKNSNHQYSKKLKPNITYNAADIRSFLKLNETNDNLQLAIKEFGIQIYSENFSQSDFTGCLLRFPYLRRAAIILNDDLRNGRLNFTIAHELGHLVRAITNEDGVITDPLYMAFLYDKGEKECDKFASELLMPEKEVTQQIKYTDLDFKLISDIATYFHTSIEATINRCIDLSIDRYVSIVYESHEKVYFHCNKDYYTEISEADINESLDVDTDAYNIVENVNKFYDNYISKKKSENVSFWFRKKGDNFIIKSQVYIQHIDSKRIIVLLQLPNKELYR